MIFERWNVGGGGFVTDIKQSSDGSTMVVRTDVFGCYIRDDSTESWHQLLTNDSLKPGERPWGWGGGCYDIAVSDSDPDVLYLVSPGHETGYVFRSDDRGQHWDRMALAAQPAQFHHRSSGPKLAIDPNDSDRVLFFNSNGNLFRSADGGATWTQPGFPTGGDPATILSPCVHWAPSTLDLVYACTGPNGVHRSSDGGVTWQRVQGGPLHSDRMVVDQLGRIWVTDLNVARNVWRHADGVWTHLEPAWGDGFHSIAVNPHNPQQVTIGYAAGNINTSMDGGETWGGMYESGAFRRATDIPWLAWTLEDWMSNGNMIYDARPEFAGRLWFAEGIGIWHTIPPFDAAKPAWVEATLGNEELIVNALIKPPGGPLVISTQDRGTFALDDPSKFPKEHGPDREVPIRHAWHADHAKDDPSFLAVIVDRASGYSTDKGRTWTRFPDQRPGNPDNKGHLGGCIAVATTQNIVWQPSNNGAMWWTKDQGETWQLCTLPENFSVGPPESGWAFSQYQKRKPLCADPVNLGTFYAYNYRYPAPAGKECGSFLRSSDGGETFEQVSDGIGTLGSMGSGMCLRAVPGTAGHLWWSCGLSAPNPYDQWMQYSCLMRSTDGAATWERSPGWTEAHYVTFGKAKEGDYPDVYVFGSREGDAQPALYRLHGDEWQKIEGHEDASIDMVLDIAGDMEQHGTIYMGLGGSGVIWGHDDESPIVEPEPTPEPGQNTTSITINITVTSTLPVQIDVSSDNG